MNIDFGQIKSFYDGKAGFIAGLSQQVGLDSIFNRRLEQSAGRPVEISYGVIAQLMLINIADEHHPLSRLDEYYQDTDLESLFQQKIDYRKLNDDRFGGFLDAMSEAGCSNLLSDISVNAFKRYGIKLSSVNFDTTSKVMWGEYATEEGTSGAIDITFGYSKQKRFDKKQIKFSLGTTQGICIDGQVLSGNIDDKTFNVDNLDRAVELKKRFESNNDEFFYIADSAAFTKAFLDKAALLDMAVITRMPDNIKETKAAIHYAWEHIGELEKVEIPTATSPSVYHVYESDCVYQGIPLKMAVCYSEKLKPQKQKTVEKRVAKESKDIEKLIKSFKDRSYACEEDALLEIAKITKQNIEKLNYHNIEISIDTEVTRRRGRPSQDTSNDIINSKYILNFSVVRDENIIRETLEKECLFVVVSTKLSMNAIEILMEYKTQSAVERKFQFLKSPQFVSSFFLDSPKRVEALGYLLLILMLLLSIAEYVVRRELSKENAAIIGPGKVKMDRPSMLAIYRIFYSVVTSTVAVNGVMHRGFNKPLADNVQTVMEYLGIPKDIFIRGAD